MEKNNSIVKKSKQDQPTALSIKDKKRLKKALIFASHINLGCEFYARQSLDKVISLLEKVLKKKQSGGTYL